MKIMPHFKIAFIMTENIFAREVLNQDIERGGIIDAVIIEKSEFAERNKSYLVNDFYNPPELGDLLKKSKAKIFYTANHNAEDCREILLRLKPDLIFLGGVRIIKQPIIDTASIGVLNSHPGLLPKYRGQDIVGWAIYNNEAVGATCHFIDTGIDTGPILLKKEVGYEKGETLLQIRVAVMKVCAELLFEAAKGLEKGTLKPRPQKKEEGENFPAMPENIVKLVEEKLLS